MTSITKFSRWLLVATCASEGLFFLFVAYFAYGFDRAFRSQWIFPNFMQNVMFLSTGVFFLFVAYLIFRRRPRARYLSALLLCGAIIWIFVDTLTKDSPAWSELIWAALPISAFGFLLYAWNKRDLWCMENAS